MICSSYQTAMNGNTPRLRHVFPKGKLVSGVTALANELFVIRYPCDQQVEVYDTTTFEPTRQLIVPGLCDVMWWGHALASCVVNNSLYVTDYNTSTVHRAQASGNLDVINWRTGTCPTGLSVTDATHVLVTCCSVPYKIEEYMACGTPVREILLHQEVSYPYHAVQLSSGHFAVSHEGPTHGVSVVGGSGQVLRNFRRQLATAVGQLKCPRQISVDKDDCIYVADRDNNRVRRLFNFGSDDFQVSPDDAMQGPCTLCLDESRGRLYVGEWRGGRILVFENVVGPISSNCSSLGRRNLRF